MLINNTQAYRIRITFFLPIKNRRRKSQLAILKYVKLQAWVILALIKSLWIMQNRRLGLVLKILVLVTLDVCTMMK